MNLRLNQKKTKESSDHTRLRIVSLGLDVAFDDFCARRYCRRLSRLWSYPKGFRIKQPACEVVLEDRNRVIVGPIEFEEAGYTSIIVFAFLLYEVVKFSREHLVFIDIFINVGQ
jgi:hypothetical protein